MRSAILFASAAAFASAAHAQEEPRPYVFERFVGEWKLKDDTFQQIWDGKTVQTLTIPGHRTRCAPVNTDMSILCEVDAVDFQGHILWGYDGSTQTVRHLSHFGTSRLGNGSGSLDEAGNLALTISFADEPEGFFRRYRYEWVSSDEYHMMSRQYDQAGKPTGNWYGGSFVRVDPSAGGMSGE